jgi:hypothetical protein
MICLNKLQLKKINDNNYKILENDKQVILDFQGIKFPFGLEKFNNVYYLNIEINNKDIINKIKLIEKEIEEIVKTDIKYVDYNFISNIKQRDKYLPLLKTRVINKNKKFICDSNISLFEISNNRFYNIEIIIQSIWFHDNKTFGLLLQFHKLL